MSKYTQREDPAVDNRVQADLDIICRALVDRRAELGLRAVILTGGFSRGEGSVLLRDGVPVPLNDYDIYVVTDKKQSINPILSPLSAALTRELGIDIDLMPWHWPRDKKDKPLIINYETLAGAGLLWGQDITASLPAIDPNLIPLWDGVFLLFNRTASLLIGHPAYAAPEMTIYQCGKGMLGCCEALLLAMGRYHYSYAERCRRFTASFTIAFPELARAVPSLPELVQRFTDFKLLPDYSAFMDAPELWTEVTGVFIRVFWHYLHLVYQRPQDNRAGLLKAFMAEQAKPLRSCLAWYDYRKSLPADLRPRRAFYPRRAQPGVYARAALPFILEAVYNKTEPAPAAAFYLGQVIKLPPEADRDRLRELALKVWKTAPL